MVAMVQAKPERVPAYDDSPDDLVVNVAKERAYRQGFLESARHIVAVWAHPPGPPPIMDGPKSIQELLDNRRCDPFKELEEGRRLRQRVRERFAVYGPGDAGRKTYHLGYRPNHALAAARLRGRHHAMVFATEPWDGFKMFDIDIYDPKLLCPWLREVEVWAGKPIKPDSPLSLPPRLMESAKHTGYLDESDPPHPIVLTVHSPSQDRRIKPAVDAVPPWKTEEAMASASTSTPQMEHTGPAESVPPRIHLTRADQIEIRPPEWLLRGVLERDTFALVFGDPGSGKSFLAIDWACRVATGAPWCGQAVKAGPVVYVAGEGQQGFGRRIRAWSEHHGVTMDEVPLYVSPSVAIPDIADLEQLIEAIDHLNLHPTLIVLDTLARCFGSGDENATQDMGQFVKACDVLRGRYQGCAILVVHHTGHADKTRARGAIALKAALDAEYRLTHDDNLLLTATKMKDAEMPPPLAMKLTSVELPGLLDEHGNPVTSAVVEVLDAQPDAIIKQASDACRGKWQRLGLDAARRLARQCDDGRAALKDWHAECEALGMKRSTRYDVLSRLEEQQAVTLHGDHLIPA